MPYQSSPCRCDECSSSGGGTGLGAFPEGLGCYLGSYYLGPDFDPNAPGAPQSEQAWWQRAISWGIGWVRGRLPACTDPFTDPEVSRPCPGEIGPARARRAWANAPTPARAELWGRAVANNPQWRCSNPGSILSDPRTAVVVMRAAAGGRDCHMSNDRGGLSQAWDRFVAGWENPVGEPGWIDEHILGPIGAGAAGETVRQLLPFAAAGLLIFATTRGR